MMNQIFVMGRLTRDPDLRTTPSGVRVASFSVACERDYSAKDGGERETDFLDCVAWRTTGEFVAKYFPKGSMIALTGRLQIRDWVDKDGGKRRSAEIVVEQVWFAGSKAPSGAQSAPEPPKNPEAPPTPEAPIPEESPAGMPPMMSFEV